MKKALTKYFVIVRLDVNESGSKKAVENPGAAEWLDKLGGAEAGIPFFAFLSPNGKKIGDSLIMPHKQNVGFPGGAEEIQAFEQLLKRVSPRMTAADLRTVTTAFREAARKLERR